MPPGGGHNAPNNSRAFAEPMFSWNANGSSSSGLLEVSAGLRAKIFALAAELHDFQSLDLDVHRKIANLGEKTFRWEQGGISHETKFNYTLNSAATRLLQIFERLARQQEHYALLERGIRYDRLGVNDVLLQFESDLIAG